MNARRSISIAAVAVAALLATPALRAVQNVAKPSDEAQRIEDSVKVLNALTSAPDDGIPQNLLQKSEGIVVIPTLIKGGFVIGAKHGRGVMSARNEARGWSVPAFVKMSGGSIGWQIGVESIDLVLLVMNKDGVNSLLDDRFTIGGNLSVAAGPLGRSGDAATDVKVASQILAYSKARGFFAGATFEGAALHEDEDANQAMYGPNARLKGLLTSTPETAAGFRPCSSGARR